MGDTDIVLTEKMYLYLQAASVHIYKVLKMNIKLNSVALVRDLTLLTTACQRS
jgi:hypothetical protein